MLRLEVGGIQSFDEETNTFIKTGSFVLELEHSLYSLSKWEEIFQKPFLSGEPKTEEELLGYVKAMILTPNVPPGVFNKLTQEDAGKINDYINNKMTATWFREKPSGPSRKIITAELIYFWMIALSIPFECQYWHLNKLFTLIRVANEENAPKEKLSASELAQRNRSLNAQRKAQLNSTG